MRQTSSDVLQLRVEGLASLYSSLGAALSEAGLTGSEMNEIFSKHLRGECVQCGIQITGDEMGQLALAGEGKPLADSKLDRLRQGYCARNGCDSFYYRVHLGDYRNLDWVKIREKTDTLALAAQAEAAEATGANTRAVRKRLLIRAGTGVAVVVILLLWRHWFFYGYVPLLQKPHKYTIDPASAGHGPSR